MDRKLKLEDLKVGMQVHAKQLSDIYHTYIYLINHKYDDSNLDVIGEIAYFGDKSIQDVGLNPSEVCTIFHPCEEEGFDYE